MTTEDEVQEAALVALDRAALVAMSRWMAKSSARFVVIEPEIQSCQRPFPQDVLERDCDGEGLYWSVNVGVKHGDEPFECTISARTIAEAWSAALSELQKAVL